MTDPQPYSGQIDRGIGSLGTGDLVWLLLDDTYVPNELHDTVADVATYEVSGAGYARQTVTATVSYDEGAHLWRAMQDSTPSFDLSAVSNRGFLVIARDGATDADRDLVAWYPCPGPATSAFEPFFAGGFLTAGVDSTASDLADHVADLHAHGLPSLADAPDGKVLGVSGGVLALLDAPGGGGSGVQQVHAVDFLVADDDFSSGTLTTVTPVDADGSPLLSPTARGDLAGALMAVYDGDDGGKVFTLTASGPCTPADVQPATGDFVVSNRADEPSLRPTIVVAWNTLGTDGFADREADPDHFRPISGSEATLLASSVFSHAVGEHRMLPFVGHGFDGGGTDSVIDESRVGDDPGYYVPNDPMVLSVTGDTMPGTGVAVVALRNQANGINGFFEWAHVGEAVDGVTITSAMFASPQPATGDAVLKRTVELNGRWLDAGIIDGTPVVVGELSSFWLVSGTGMDCDFIDFAGGGGGVSLGETSSTAYRGDRGKTAYDHAGSTGNPHGTTPTDLTGATTSRILGRVTAGTGAVEELTASQVRTLTGLVLGTNVQAWDADLDALAALTTTSYGRSLLEQASAAAARSTLGASAKDTNWHITNSFMSFRPTEASPGTFGSAVTPVAGALAATKVVIRQDCTISGAKMYVRTQGASGARVNAGLYALSGGKPDGAPLLSTGEVDVTTTGYKNPTFTGVAIGAGSYALVWWTNDTTVRMQLVDTSTPGNTWPLGLDTDTLSGPTGLGYASSYASSMPTLTASNFTLQSAASYSPLWCPWKVS